MQDLQMQVAMQTFGLVTKGKSFYKDGNKLGKAKVRKYRRLGKIINFGALYGSSL